VSTDDRLAITELLYRYGELMDAGDFEGVERLLHRARIRIAPGHEGLVDSERMLAIWKATVILYADGTPHTRHVITNPIVTLDDDASGATARSVYTVFQQMDGSVQPIVSGRYRDRFARRADGWSFSERDYTLVDLVGDVSGHLRIELSGRV